MTNRSLMRCSMPAYNPTRQFTERMLFSGWWIRELSLRKPQED